MSDEFGELDIVADYAAAVSVLARIRKAKRLTQEALGERLGVTQATVARHESGNRVRSGAELFAAAHALGLDIAFVPRAKACPTCGGEMP
jgi:transcriptional regulator with XRE-family HTH domain